MSATTVLNPQDENESEVRREDQNNINQFARLNARLHALRQKKERLQKELESLDDASTELMMISGNTQVLLTMGEAFFEIPEDEATEYCEKLVEEYQQQVDVLQQEEETIRSEQAKLKTVLYGRFGKSINLEE